MSHVDPGRVERTRPVLNRRERLRQATLEEIVEAGRSLLRAGREVTLRAVAAEMGFTAPALYRYVGSVAALNDLLSNDIFAEIVREMAAAAEPYGDDDPAAQMVAAASAFRGWALDHIDEFQLVFQTNSLSGEHVARSEADGRSTRSRRMRRDPPAGCSCSPTSSGRSSSGWHSGSRSPFPPGRNSTRSSWRCTPRRDGRPDVAELLGPDGLGMIWLFELAWAQLYGIVTLEVFGHVRPQLVRSGRSSPP
ncbi:hypothetical protein DN402_01685 [Streptomyces sp. SW4]|nr:hypothetical protein DN402_01685 [Streptomyces sp. SW4]